MPRNHFTSRQTRRRAAPNSTYAERAAAIEAGRWPGGMAPRLRVASGSDDDDDDDDEEEEEEEEEEGVDVDFFFLRSLC